jgi:hypothetical protein
VNVHMNLEEYVTGEPSRHLELMAEILKRIEKNCQGNVRANLVVAYEDSHISERRHLGRLRDVLGWDEARFTTVDCLTEWEQGFPTLGSAELTIASSYHVTLTSLILSVPVMLLCSNQYYRHKAKGLKQAFGVKDGLAADVGSESREDVLQLVDRLVTNDTARRQSTYDTAFGIAEMSMRSASATARLARFWSGSYQSALEERYRICATDLVESMKQLSEIKFEYQRLLNLSAHGGVEKASQHDEGYAALVHRIREVADTLLPTESKVLVVSRGGEELRRLGEREAWHFPQNRDGIYAGHHPRDSQEAIEHLEELRGRGADYMLFPSTALWWLNHYSQFSQHLRERYWEVFRDDSVCLIYALREPAKTAAMARRIRSLEEELRKLTDDTVETAGASDDSRVLQIRRP